jgi:hypothetical protein
MQTPGGNLANADTKTSALTLPATGAGRNPTPAEFTRVQSKFAKGQRTLHRVRSLASVTAIGYTVNHRGDARHFRAWPDVLEHLAEIGAAR